MENFDQECPGPRPATSLASVDINSQLGDSPPAEYNDDSHNEDYYDDDQESQQDDQDDQDSTTGLKSPRSAMSKEYAYVDSDEDDEFNPEFHSDQLSELMEYMSVYTPLHFELDTKLNPFIPDYIPCIADIDAFIKCPRPDLKPETLGLVELDEPSVKHYSDPRVLDLQLRSLSKSSNAPVNIHSISDLANLSDWLVKIEQLGKTKPYHNVVYSRPFPDIDDLMQAWDSPIEKALEHTALPPADVDLTLDEYTRMVAALLDIPVNESKVPIHENGFKESNLIESLHCVFSLYSAFKESGHFKDLNNGYPADAIAKAVE